MEEFQNFNLKKQHNLNTVYRKHTNKLDKKKHTSVTVNFSRGPGSTNTPALERSSGVISP